MIVCGLTTLVKVVLSKVTFTAGRGSFNLLSALESKVDAGQQQKSKKLHSFGSSAGAADDVAVDQQTRPAAAMPSSTMFPRCPIGCTLVAMGMTAETLCA